MGRLKKGILHGFSGTVGPVVGGRWRGVEYMRSKSSNRKAKTSPAQEIQRAKFALAIKFVGSMKDLLEISHRDYTTEMTGANSAQSQILKSAVKGIYPDVSIGYSKAAVAMGRLANATEASVVCDDPDYGFMDCWILFIHLCLR